MVLNIFGEPIWGSNLNLLDKKSVPMQRGARSMICMGAPMQHGARFPIPTDVPVQRGDRFPGQGRHKMLVYVMFCVLGRLGPQMLLYVMFWAGVGSKSFCT